MPSMYVPETKRRSPRICSANDCCYERKQPQASVILSPKSRHLWQYATAALRITISKVSTFSKTITDFSISRDFRRSHSCTCMEFSGFIVCRTDLSSLLFLLEKTMEGRSSNSYTVSHLLQCNLNEWSQVNEFARENHYMTLSRGIVGGNLARKVIRIERQRVTQRILIILVLLVFCTSAVRTVTGLHERASWIGGNPCCS